MIDWKVVRSTSQVKPAELDITSSSFYVYERRNIHQEEFNDNMNDEPITEWVFEERCYTKDEYSTLNSPTTQLLMQHIADLEVEIYTLRSEVECLKN